MNGGNDWVNERTLIPDLLRAAPQARPVLDRYGLRGCGGEFGPVESLEFFANAHDVRIEQLLGEIRTTLEQPAPAAAQPAGSYQVHAADSIYRPFFQTGILVILTLGATWGAYLLMKIGFLGSFSAVNIHEVNAHGHAQIFGWVGLFVMGFAYQAFPRFKHTSLAHPRLAQLSFWLMVVGLVVRSLLEPVAPVVSLLKGPAIVASALEVAAIGLFIWIIARTWHAAGKPLAIYDSYIISAMFWFLVQAIYEGVYLAATLMAPTREELLTLVATWQAPLRDIQIHGFALLMILGVSQRIFHYFYGFRAPTPWKSVTALVLLNLAIVGEVVGLVLMRKVGHQMAGVWYLATLLLSAAVVLLVHDWKLFAKPHESDRSLKFLRVAYVWLLVSLAMQILLPVYQRGVLPALAPESGAAQLGFSHAYYGAIRHAITVGFISLMIVGVAAKVVPTLNGVNVRQLSGLWGPFVLINAGCTLRVVGQTVTDFTAWSFPVAGVSGVLEVAGLALWGVHLWLIMIGRARLRPAVDATHVPVVHGTPIVAGHRVGEVLGQYPELLDTFVGFGFVALKNPFLRRTVAGQVTIAQACRLMSVNLEQLLNELNAERERRTTRRQTLPVLSVN